MSSNLAGIDPHQASFTIGIIDRLGLEIGTNSFTNTGQGIVEAIDWLATHSVATFGIEGSASWGSHIAIAVVAGGLDAREVPAQRTALQRRARRLDKTDNVDALCVARALLSEPDLGPIQTLEVYDPLVAKIEAVLEHRRALVAVRTLMLNHVQAQLAKLPIEVRDELAITGKIESRLRQLEDIELSVSSTLSGDYRLSWLRPLVDSDRAARREIRRLEHLIGDLLDEHGTTLREESGVGPIAAATLVCEVGDPFRFSRESKFARWCGTGAIALSSGEGAGLPVRHRLDFRGNRRINSVLYVASITQQRDNVLAQAYLSRKLAEGKTRREARRAHKRQLANRVIRRMWRDERARVEALPVAA